MDREQFKKEFEQFSKELNEEFKNGLIDGVLITKGGNKNHLFNKEEARQFFDELFSLADEFEAMNKKDCMKENYFSSLSSSSNSIPDSILDFSSFKIFVYKLIPTLSIKPACSLPKISPAPLISKSLEDIL